jgi:MbtH protein
MSTSSSEQRQSGISDGPPSTFQVVVNAEQQYSIWDTRRAIPAGWSSAGFEGPEVACLDHIDSVWTDMRPLSLRTRNATA